MGYTALYRKFRPITFSELVGQEHITRTLRNQIIADRVGHAYLFNGGRGTGKTSSAKILARAINCLNPKDGEPCNECEICKAALSGALTDIVEMDAASNNSVEEMREYIGCDSLKFLSIEGMIDATENKATFCKACFDGDYPVKKIDKEEQLSC